MSTLLSKIWKSLPGSLQWRMLWLIQDKFILGICGVLFDDHDEVLLLRHRFWKRTSWGLPGGYSKRGERIEHTLAREVMEETGLQINDISLFCINSGYKVRVEIVLVGRIRGGVLKLDKKEILEAKFFPIDRLPDGLVECDRTAINSIAGKKDSIERSLK